MACFGITLILIIHYFKEKNTGLRLSARYRNNIFETQSKIFLNATEYLIKGEKDLAIKEFLNAVDVNKETIETYFALGGLFRSNGEIDKAISIHRSIVARDNLSESQRLRGLKELAIDFDKGGLIDRAIETYQDVLKINRDQSEVILALCRIYEDLEDWDEAFTHRMMLSKLTNENQSESISYILSHKAWFYFQQGKIALAQEEMNHAFKYAPSITAKIVRLQIYLVSSALEDAKIQFIEILKEHPMYSSFIFETLKSKLPGLKDLEETYLKTLSVLQQFFLDSQDKELNQMNATLLAKMQILKTENKHERAFEIFEQIWKKSNNKSEYILAEYILQLIEQGKTDQALEKTKKFLTDLKLSTTAYHCGHCGLNSDSIFWRCPQCHQWKTIQIRWKI